MHDSLNGRGHYAKGIQEFVERGLPQSIKPLVEDITAEVKANLERAQLAGKRAYRSTERSVREHPVVTVLAVTAAIGLIWSLFGTRKTEETKSDYAY